MINTKSIMITLGGLYIASIVQVSLAAGAPPVQIQFTPNTPAKAVDVNANFQELADRIGLTYDYRNYATPSTITNMTYKISGNGFVLRGCDTDSWQIVHGTPVNGITNIDLTRVRKSSTSTTVCANEVLHFQSRSDGYYWTGLDVYDVVTLTTKQYSDVITDGILERTSSMAVGKVYGGASPVVVSNYTVSPTVTTTGTNNDSAVLLGIENVTVPYGSYNNCLKISNARTSGTQIGAGQYVSWFCPNIGLVKRINSAGDIFELQSVN